MYFSPSIDAAIKLASRLHRDQVRNDSARTPYISHLIAVAMLIREATEDENVIIAGLMHDSLEDVNGYSYEKLVEDCGEKVANIVKHVTEPLDASKSSYEQLPWLTRKEAYLATLREGGKESALVSVCDKIHNARCFFYDIEKEGEEFLKRFSSGMHNRIWFQEQVLHIVSGKLGENHIYVQELAKLTQELHTLNQKMAQG